MKSKIILTATIAILTLSPCLLAEDAKYAPINPALLYWQSAAVMSDLKDEKATSLKNMVAGNKPFDSGKANEILSGSEQSLMLFAKAAMSSAPCDWGLHLEEGPELALPHLSKIRQLSQLAILKADELFSEGKNLEGVDWLLKAHRSARHAGAGEILLSVLVEISMETAVIKAAALHCLGWDDETRKKYAEGLQALPPLHRLQDCFRAEMVTADSRWFEDHFRSTDPESRKEMDNIIGALSNWSPQPSIDRQTAIKMFREQFTPESWPKRIGEWRDTFHRAGEAMGKPWKESQSELEEIGKHAQQGNILMRLNYPIFGPVNAKRFELATLRTMLDAALKYGPKLDEIAAAAYKDGFEGEPLQLTKAEDGSLRLRAARQYAKPGSDIELKLAN